MKVIIEFNDRVDLYAQACIDTEVSSIGNDFKGKWKAKLSKKEFLEKSFPFNEGIV